MIRPQQWRKRAPTQESNHFMKSNTLYHSDPTTGEVFETITFKTPAEKKFLMSPDGGSWWETPRWHTDPKPHRYDPSNPYESPAEPVAYEEFPRLMHKRAGMDKDTKEVLWKTLKVKNEEEKAIALKGGYLLVPNEEQHKQLVGTAA